MRILLFHNYYQYPGGEDVAFASEKSLLLEHKNLVFEYKENNKRIESLGYINSAIQTIWSRPSYRAIKRIIEDVKPDIAHFHNTFMLISPSAYYACAEMGVPVIQTLHNYRLLCPNAYLFRDGAPCEDCIRRKLFLPGIIHKCFRGSLAQSAVVAAMLEYHRLIRTWQSKVDLYIVLTEFARQKFIQGGLPEEKIIVKPNMATGIGMPRRTIVGEYVLCIGRLTAEKGIDTLLSAWDNLEIPIKIAGDGPMSARIQERADNSPFVEYLGQLSQKSVMDLFGQARFVVFPSKLYEGLPMIIVESFAIGVPVIASNLASRRELIREFETGLLYTPGDAADLADKVEWLWSHPEACIEMGRNARRVYEEKYTPERNYQMLMDIYTRAMTAKR